MINKPLVVIYHNNKSPYHLLIRGFTLQPYSPYFNSMAYMVFSNLTARQFFKQ